MNVNVNLNLLLHKLSGLNYNLISPNTHHYPGLVYHRGVFYTTRKVQSNLYYEFSIHLVHKLCAGAAPHHATRRYWEKRHVVWGPLGVSVVGKKHKKATNNMQLPNESKIQGDHKGHRKHNHPPSLEVHPSACLGVAGGRPHPVALQAVSLDRVVMLAVDSTWSPREATNEHGNKKQRIRHQKIEPGCMGVGMEWL